MSRRRRGFWITAWGAGVITMVAMLAAVGVRLGWWQALAGDPADDPWGWVERVGWITGVLGFPVTIFFGVLALRQAAAVVPVTVAQRRRWRLIPVNECQPEQLGVHRAPAVGQQAGQGMGLPSYVLRDHDRRLRERLRSAATSGGLLVVVGGSSTGKSRSLYEAVRNVCEGWQLLLVDDVEALRQATDELPGRTVVWLDDTPSVRYLAHGGLTRTDVLALINRERVAGPVVVVDMLWPGPYQQLTAVPQASSNPDSRVSDPWRDAREVLALGGEPDFDSIVRVPEQFSQRERDRVADTATATADRRLVRALADIRYGVTQHLAGVPHLVNHWENSTGVEPYGAAILTAAIDIRRLGVRAPLGVELLTAVAPIYLTDTQLAQATSDWFDVGLAYATQRLPGDVQALYPVPGPKIGTVQGYEVADYLQQHGAKRRYFEVLPEPLWDALSPYITDVDDLLQLAGKARELDMYDQSIVWYRRAYPHVMARFHLQQLLVEQGRVDELRRLVADGDDNARHWLANLLIEQGQVDEAIEELRQLVNANDPFARPTLIKLLVETGRVDEAIAVERTAAATRADYDNSRLVSLLIGQGRADEAIRELRGAVTAGAHFARERLAYVLIELGRVEEGIEEMRIAASISRDSWPRLLDLLEEYGRIDELFMELRRKDTYAAHWRLLRLLVQQGRIDELRELAFRGDSSAIHRLANFLREQGQVAELRELAAIHPAAKHQLAQLLASQNKVDEAIAELRDLSEAGENSARTYLIKLLAERERVDELRELVMDGDDRAARQLITVLCRQGRVREAVIHARKMMAAGDLLAVSRVADLVAEQERIDVLWELADAGEHRAKYWRAELLAKQERAEELQELATTGDRQARNCLAKLLRDQGRLSELRALASDDDDYSRRQLVDLLAEQGNTEELRKIAIDGDTRHRLVTVLVQQGKVNEAVAELRRIAAADPYASLRLANLLVEQGRVDEAIEELRESTAAGHDTARLRLIELLEQHGRIDDLRDMAAVGDHDAKDRLSGVSDR
ncbi:tetratricopeptide repeat protein [Micromonospora sp. NPDC126480]|uniref:tetratricopeptide repeat protein n=1 Tax=Micromonospora sp. NPDC126480 TaxID=3155312 RepID=UPI00331D639A